MSNSSNKNVLRHSCLLVSLLAAMSLPAQAIPIKVNITIDNSYALFYGSQTAATNFVGSDFEWTTTETYNFNLPSNQYLYVIRLHEEKSQSQNANLGYETGLIGLPGGSPPSLHNTLHAGPHRAFPSG